MNSIETFSIVCGTAACNARCPFCVSKMTGINELGIKPQPVNWRNFEKASLMAKDGGVRSVLITGKGEPTLFPEQVTDYLKHLEPHRFPLIDLQTNGLKIAQQPEKYTPYLKDWYEHGLAFVAISVVHWLAEQNHEVYNPYQKEYIELPKLIDQIHDVGLSARFSCTMFNGGIDSADKVKEMIAYSKKLGVEQLTLRKMAKSDNAENPEITAWTDNHLLKPGQVADMAGFLEKNGRLLATTEKRANIFDVDGQNVCLTDALTIEPTSNDYRQIIFFPNGRVRFDWQSNGAVLL